jgi:hypothetical protein
MQDLVILEVKIKEKSIKSFRSLFHKMQENKMFLISKFHFEFHNLFKETFYERLLMCPLWQLFWGTRV